MTFNRSNGSGVFHCDTCPEAIDTGETDFNDALLEAKRRGWRTYQGPDKQWAHACPSCVEDHAKERSDGRK